MKLSRTEIIEILSNWGIKNVVSFHKAEKGESNHNWIIQTQKDKFVLRRAPNFRKLNELKFELDYLIKLKENNFPYSIPAPLKNVRGKYLLNYKGGSHWIYKFIKGKVREEISLELIPELARMLAAYHLFLERIKISNGKSKTEPFDKGKTVRDLKKLYKITYKIKNKNSVNLTFLKEYSKLMPILKSLKNRDYERLPQYPIHRDLNPENILWKNKKISGIIDFENVGTMNDILATDIAFCIMYAATTEKRHRLNVRKAKKFIEFYKKHRKLSKQEISLIPEIIVAGFIGAFSWQYWLQIYDPARAQAHRIKLYSNSAQWHHINKHKIIQQLLWN